MLKALRKELTVVRELSVDQPRGQGDSAQHEQNLVLANADLQLVVVDVCCDPRKLLKSSGWHIDLERGAERLVEQSLLDAQPIGIRRHHPQLAVRSRYEDAGQHRSC